MRAILAMKLIKAAQGSIALGGQGRHSECAGLVMCVPKSRHTPPHTAQLALGIECREIVETSLGSPTFRALASDTLKSPTCGAAALSRGCARLLPRALWIRWTPFAYTQQKNSFILCR